MKCKIVYDIVIIKSLVDIESMKDTSFSSTFTRYKQFAPNKLKGPLFSFDDYRMDKSDFLR